MKNKNAAIFAEVIDDGENTKSNIRIAGNRNNIKILVGLMISQLCSGNFLSMIITALECVYKAYLAKKARVKD